MYLKDNLHYPVRALLLSGILFAPMAMADQNVSLQEAPAADLAQSGDLLEEERASLDDERWYSVDG